MISLLQFTEDGQRLGELGEEDPTAKNQTSKNSNLSILSPEPAAVVPASQNQTGAHNRCTANTILS